MTDFEKAYNRICRGRVADTRHINDSEEIWNAAIKFERKRCAKILNDRSKKCANQAGEAEDEKDRIDLRAQAWTFSVIEQEILNDT